jgi:PAS domain S-box-containing protein
MVFPNLLIKRKLILVILLTSLVVLLMSSAAFFIYELLASRRQLVDHVRALAEVTAFHASTALIFRNQQEAMRTLAAVQAEEHIEAAALYDLTGSFFAGIPSYQPPSFFPQKIGPDGPRFQTGSFSYFEPVWNEEHERVGTLYLRSNLAPLYDRFHLYTAIGAIVMGVSFLVALLLSHLLQKSVSEPILKLASTARQISQVRDYNVRAQKVSDDELGLLTDAFNHMLSQIQDRESALEESAERLRLALDASQTGIWDWHVLTNKVIWDESVYGQLGLRPGEGEGTYESFLARIHPEDREATAQAIKDAIQNRKEFSAEFRVVWPQGSIHYLTARGKALYDNAGNPVRMTGVSIDITDRKRAEDARSFLASIVESSEDAIIGKTLDGTIVSWNSGAERMFGYTAKEMIGKPISALLDPDLAEEEGDMLRQVQRGNPVEHYETLRVRKGGEAIYVSLSASPIRNAKGEIVGISTITRDMSERIRAEEEIRRLNSQLEERVKERTLELTRANKELEAFAYSVSHDLRAPLRHIDAFAKIIEEEMQPGTCPQIEQYVGRIRKGIQTMGHLVDDLLNLSRIGRAEMVSQKADLNDLVQETLADIRRETDSRDIEFRIGDLPEAQCDPGLMKQVFANLLSNAVKYTRPRSKAIIEVNQTRIDEDTVIYVRDNGVGFNMKYVGKLFGVFERLHRADEFEGTGIGLAVVRRIIQRHGGKVWAEAMPDQGATFYFTLGKIESTSPSTSTPAAG